MNEVEVYQKIIAAAAEAESPSDALVAIDFARQKIQNALYKEQAMNQQLANVGVQQYAGLAGAQASNSHEQAVQLVREIVRDEISKNTEPTTKG